MDVYAPEITHSLYLSNVLTEMSRFNKKFYFSEKFLALKLESIEREVQKTIESRKQYKFSIPFVTSRDSVIQ